MEKKGYAAGTVFHRQLGLFDPEKYNAPVTIVGAGAIGSNTALCLAKMGIGPITVYDADGVEPHNQAGQLYSLDDIAKPKVTALNELVSRLADVEIVPVEKMWEPADGFQSRIVISAVDSMKVRKEIFEAVKYQMGQSLFVDGRIGGLTAWVLFAGPMDYATLKRYEKHLYDDDHAVDLPCTERSIYDVNLVIAGMIARGVRDHLVHGTVPGNVIYDAANGVWIPER